METLSIITLISASITAIAWVVVQEKRNYKRGQEHKRIMNGITKRIKP